MLLPKVLAYVPLCMQGCRSPVFPFVPALSTVGAVVFRELPAVQKNEHKISNSGLEIVFYQTHIFLSHQR